MEVEHLQRSLVFLQQQIALGQYHIAQQRNTLASVRDHASTVLAGEVLEALEEMQRSLLERRNDLRRRIGVAAE